MEETEGIASTMQLRVTLSKARKGSSTMHRVGDRVYFWTGRGSQGYAIIREIKGDHFLLDPEPDAIKGSDYTNLINCSKPNYWAPRDRGVFEDQINSPPRIWYTNF